MPNRRQFMQTAAAAGFGYWAAGGAQAKESRSPNERIALASIGVGGNRGGFDSDAAGRAGDMVAVCDVDDRFLDLAVQKRFKKAKRFNDFRKLFDAMGKSIDAVTIAIPDHAHFVAAATALKLKKHCYLEKPLTHSIHEARELARLAAESGAATQMGNQGTATNGLRKTAALVKAGALGAVKEVHAWTDRPIWPQGINRPASCTPPATLHWDLWLAASRSRPYAKEVYHPFRWRAWWDFGGGALGDMGCHTLNMPYAALDLRNPISVRAETSGHNGDSFPSWSKITFDFAAAEQRGPVAVYWYDGGKHPPSELFGGRKIDRAGSLLVGEKGIIYSPGDVGDQMECIGKFDLPEVKFSQSPGHFAEWIRAVQGGAPAMSNFPDYAGPLTETVLLGNLAVWVAAAGQGEKIEWDAKNMKVKNIPALDDLIRPPYRAGYSL